MFCSIPVGQHSLWDQTDSRTCQVSPRSNLHQSRNLNLGLPNSSQGSSGLDQLSSDCMGKKLSLGSSQQQCMPHTSLMAGTSLTALPECLRVGKCHSWLSANLPKTDAEVGSVTWHAAFSQSSAPSKGLCFCWFFFLSKKLSVKLSLLESVLLTSEKCHFRLKKA